MCKRPDGVRLQRSVFPAEGRSAFTSRGIERQWPSARVERLSTLMLRPTSRVRPDAYEAVFGALAHPARRRVLLAIYFNGGAMTAGEIAAIFAHAWQTTTRHLQ